MKHAALLLGLVVLAGAWTAGCQRDQTDSQIVPPPATRLSPATSPAVGSGASHSNSRAATEPTSPIKLEKPRVLGPVGPAVVVLPNDMMEPYIRVRLTGEMDEPPTLSAQNYRGRVEVSRLADGKFVAVNALPMESYLAGVLSKELYGSWSEEAYKAQAIAARTYAVYQIFTRDKALPWDVAGDTSSQMYGGLRAESKKARFAVAETRGQVLISEPMGGGPRGVFCAFYSACDGGMTQDPFEAWGDAPVKALAARRVGPMDRDCPKYSWPAMRISKLELTRVLRIWGQRNGFGYLADLEMIRHAVITKHNAATGRPMEITVADGAGHVGLLRAEEFRLALLDDPAGAAPRPPSSNFDLVDAGDDVILTNGHGYGHGIGLSQWGAQNMAVQGKTAEEILAFYYPGAGIRTAWR